MHMRVAKIREVVGQRSHMFRVLLRALFVGEQSFETSGVLVHAGDPHLLFAGLMVLRCFEQVWCHLMQWKVDLAFQGAVQ